MLRKRFTDLFSSIGPGMGSHKGAQRRRMRFAVPALVLGIILAVLAFGVHSSFVSALFSSQGTIRSEPLWNIDRSTARVTLAPGLNEAEAERARKIVVDMLALLYEKEMLPFQTKDYARTKGVLDRVPLERFMEKASQQLGGRELEHCLEWGPFFTRWPNVTQPYMKLFNCKHQWAFYHDGDNPRVRTLGPPLTLPAVFGDLDHPIDQQGSLSDVKQKFNLVIIPQTLQYVLDPHLSTSILYDLVKPGGHLVFSTPFMQTIMPYPTDYFRFTAEGNEMMLKKAGFDIVKSYVGGDDFWSICWIMHCGVSDLSPHMLKKALTEQGGDYSKNSYMLSAQLAKRPLRS